MRAYVIRRILFMIPTFFLVTLIVFGTIRLIPGNVVDLIMSNSQVITHADRAAMEHMMGLDQPFYIQYGKWIGNILLHGDFGKSLMQGTPVIDMISDRLPLSFELGLLGIIVSLIMAIPIGIYSAIRQDSLRDYIGRSISIACIAIPGFWLATLVVVFPAIWWHWSPSLTYIPFWHNPAGNLVQFIIPAVILGMGTTGGVMRMIRTMMLEVMRQDYVRTAWSKGLTEKTVILRHTLKNAMIPIVTIVGMQLPMMIGGQVILEQIFGLPGMGLLMINALNNRDYTLIGGITVFVAAAVLVINLFVDLAYAWLDPRIHYN